MKAQVNFDALGGGGGGKSFSFVATTADTATDLGFVPTKVVAYCYGSSINVRVFELDVTDSKIWMFAGTTSGRVDRTSLFSSSYYLDGTTLHYKALDNDYAVMTYFVAIKE